MSALGSSHQRLHTSLNGAISSIVLTILSVSFPASIPRPFVSQLKIFFSKVRQYYWSATLWGSLRHAVGENWVEFAGEERLIDIELSLDKERNVCDRSHYRSASLQEYSDRGSVWLILFGCNTFRHPGDL